MEFVSVFSAFLVSPWGISIIVLGTIGAFMAAATGLMAPSAPFSAVATSVLAWLGAYMVVSFLGSETLPTPLPEPDGIYAAREAARPLFGQTAALTAALTTAAVMFFKVVLALFLGIGTTWFFARVIEALNLSDGLEIPGGRSWAANSQREEKNAP
jgi:hypothetical protein